MDHFTSSVNVKGSAESGLVQRVRASLRRGDLPPVPHVLVGYSGGGDSLVLLMTLLALQRTGDLRVSAVHVDHGVRDESAIVAQSVSSICTQLGVPLEICRVTDEARQRHRGVGLEEALRRERFRAFSLTAERANADIIAVAHHQRDQVETVLLHLLRGSGMRGIGGMSEWSSLTVPWWEPGGRSMRVWRPLLQIPYAELVSLAKGFGPQILHDETNDLDDVRRNEVRHHLIPLMDQIAPGSTAAIARSAGIIADDDAFLDSLLPDAGFRLHCEQIRELPLVLGRRLIRRWVALHDPLLEISHERVTQIWEAVSRRRGGARIELGKGREVVVERGSLIWVSASASITSGTMEHRDLTVVERGHMDVPQDARSHGISRVLISEQEIKEAVAQIAAELDAEYANDRPLVICVLRGAVAFVADLVKAMTVPVEMDFMAISSYGASTKSSGVVRILKDLDEEVTDRRLLIVEDIVDSGLTLQYLLDHLGRRQPRDIRVVALVKKEKPDAIPVQVDRIGFTVPDEFVVGYGLDFVGEYRNLPYIGVLHPSMYMNEPEPPVSNEIDV